MDIDEHTQPERLERYSFLWSEARLLVAAVALFIGGVPPIFKITPLGLYGIVGSLLTLAWIISGITSAYLLYRWHTGGKMVFGKKDTLNTAAFLIMAISGLNLGIAGLLNTNIGMTISSNQAVFVVVGLLYILSAAQLYRGWNASGQKLF